MASAASSTLITSLAEEKTVESRFIRDEDERPKVAHNQFSDEIPIISLKGLDGDDGQRAEIRTKMAEALEDWGVFQVVDHGVDDELISYMVRLSNAFFALPPQGKLRFEMSGGNKGGFFVSSHFRGQAVQNWREALSYYTYPIGTRDYSKWPDKPQGWKDVTEIYSEKLMELARKLMEVLSEAMELDKEAIAKACMEMEQIVIVNFYPKCSQPNLTLGIKRHTDPGTLTILWQDQVGGLQVTKDGGKTWITVRPVKGAFVVNLGDHGHYLSNGRFKNAIHQAVVNSNCSRLSIATLQYPAPEAIVYPLKIEEGENAVLDEPMSFSEMYKKSIELAKLKKFG
ncbi:OLC1v1008091C1 [Oldenlandia corymbosa var. corymbosa]|uniref:OLC1v1008091C1 n=1 Tax=Oldenlandia corymbosa var. corymbosa TaxID=529605 RepID=A0AAV1DP67_OLDCO|nr:OLC1v1008091C1 [Oldenlandia corymbosa var. corymbosa]